MPLPTYLAQYNKPSILSHIFLAANMHRHQIFYLSLLKHLTSQRCIDCVEINMFEYIKNKYPQSACLIKEILKWMKNDLKVFKPALSIILISAMSIEI